MVVEENEKNVYGWVIRKLKAIASLKPIACTIRKNKGKLLVHSFSLKFNNTSS